MRRTRPQDPGKARPASARTVRDADAPPRRRTAAAGPYASFRRDHARVLTRLESLEATLQRRRAGALRVAPLRELIEHLERQFATHMAAEEAVLFPALERAFPESTPLLRPLYGEHVELRTMLTELAATLARPATRAREEQIVVQARDFTDLLRIHIRKEESAVFDVSERVLGARELRGLARRLVPFIPGAAGCSASRRCSRRSPWDSRASGSPSRARSASRASRARRSAT